ITPETISMLIELANDINLKKRIDGLFSGEQINKSEQRQALHTALRFGGNAEKLKPVFQQVEDGLERISVFIDD
ncbi:MAG: glucose-6-phosphate isomerase, partial [Aliifodinibius sp.]|nr:glucose-6-phosphate isomerase [Fodinibius sp.]